MTADGHPNLESVPLNTIAAPGLPSYNEALNHRGQHDALPPSYSEWVHAPYKESCEKESSEQVIIINIFLN